MCQLTTVHVSQNNVLCLGTHFLGVYYSFFIAVVFLFLLSVLASSLLILYLPDIASRRYKPRGKYGLAIGHNSCQEALNPGNKKLTRFAKTKVNSHAVMSYCGMIRHKQNILCNLLLSMLLDKYYLHLLCPLHRCMCLSHVLVDAYAFM